MIDITERVSRVLPRKMIISNTIDLNVIRSEESEDKLHQLTIIKIDKRGIVLYLLKNLSTVGKPTITVFYTGSRDKGILLKVQDTIDLSKPRDITDLVNASVIRLVSGEVQEFTREDLKEFDRFLK